MMMEISPSTHNVGPETRFVAFEVSGKLVDPGSAVVQFGGVAQEFEKHGIEFALTRIGGPRWELEWDREIPESMNVRLNLHAARGGPVSLRLQRGEATAAVPREVAQAPTVPVDARPDKAWISRKIGELMVAGHTAVQAATEAKKLFDAEIARIDRQASQDDQARLAARIADLMEQGMGPVQAAENAQAEQDRS